MLVAGLAEMDLAVDDAGKNVKPFCLENVPGFGIGKAADGGDSAGNDPHIRWGMPFGVATVPPRINKSNVSLMRGLG